jgi:hypothetical protein
MKGKTYVGAALDEQARGMHKPLMLVKTASGNVLDDGTVIGPHDLYCCECQCGWKGMAWYADPERAWSHYERHLP